MRADPLYVSCSSRSYNCYCVDGYTGVNCQTNWDECWSSPCLNGGQCHDGVATFNCTCQDGFAGETCDENVDECISNPCFNNATCIDANNGYVCQCSPGYYGDHCELDVSVCNSSDGERCMNGGLCVDGPGITFKCQCLPGWAGKLCQTAIDECASSPCKNGAVCVDMHATYACACPFGFTGKNCEVIVELCTFNTCENNALCIIEDGHSVCYCVPDYHGDRCQFRYDECQKGPGCLNGGSCIDGVDSYSCSCPTGLTGRFCECVISDGSIDCNHIRPTIGVPTTSSVETEYDSSTTVLVHSTDYEVSSRSGTELFTETVTQGFSTKSVTEEMIDETSPFLEEEWSTRMGTTRWTQTETSTEVDTTYASTTSDEATESWYDVTSASTGTATMERTTIGPPTSHTYVPISYFTRESTDVPGQTTSLYLTPTTEDSGPSAESRTLPPGVTEHTFPFDTPKVSIPWTSTDGAYESTTDGEETSTATALPPGCDQEPCKNGGTCHHTQTGTKVIQLCRRLLTQLIGNDIETLLQSIKHVTIRNSTV
ncbi:hypothetical protein AAG570_001906 [Ranatra chinensis]|uniref:EGF-like domain-containing protein n=1 Tax=Ranatra chinensis TaxID=642074 RepID=A0ABD0Y9W4_9HEMI